jgi:CheY-like chemotaxis protein
MTHSNEEKPHLGARRVLVIDDDEISRESMVEILRQEGHDVTSLPSPIGATKHVVQSKVEVVVIDVMMPSLRGDKLASLLTRNPKLRHLGIVLVTGAPAEELHQIAGLVNASAIVEKDKAHVELDYAVRRAGKSGTTWDDLAVARS